LVEPRPGEVRLRVLATGAGGTDLIMRRGRYPFAPPKPFVPGYEAVGVVEALGAGVTSLRLGQRVAALLVHGGYAERLVRPADVFVPVPEGIDAGDAVAMVLNYVTAYQAAHRVARIRSGERALVTGANGGVGTALLEILALAGAQAIGAAATRHHPLLRSLGAIPVDGRTAPIDRGVRALFPEGVDAAFDALGGRYVAQSRRATRRGGVVVGYGFRGTAGGLSSLRGMLAIFVGCPLFGRRGKFYGITALYRRNRQPFLEDLPKLFDLLAQGKLKPRIAARLPLLAARQASSLLESGGFEGKIVHLASIPG
jgi:NADPH2:quinone reductase